MYKILVNFTSKTNSSLVLQKHVFLIMVFWFYYNDGIIMVIHYINKNLCNSFSASVFFSPHDLVFFLTISSASFNYLIIDKSNIRSSNLFRDVKLLRHNNYFFFCSSLTKNAVSYTVWKFQNFSATQISTWNWFQQI